MRRRRPIRGMALLLAAGCAADDAPSRRPLSAELDRTSGFAVVSLSMTLRDVADGKAFTQELFPDLSIGDAQGRLFGGVLDVASLKDGSFAVLDWVERQVVIFDSVGRLVARYGREGDGPGEFRQPWALAATKDRLIVWQNRARLAFTFFTRDGKVAATAARAIKGDWDRPQFRYPQVNFDGDHRSAEDITRRLAAVGDTAFIHQLQVNEYKDIDFSVPPSLNAPDTYLVLYDLEGTVLDTLATLAGPPPHS